ncbi:MAG: hypothetical protein H6922_05855 [Pseudomonadaceae bacterium]|nr:hypothetical protein [Pseudomonadaceae bacterium]
MMRVFSLLIAVTALGGCTQAMQEQLDYAIYKDMQRWQARDRVQDFRDMFALDEIYPTYAYLEREEGKELCFHRNAVKRVVMEDGISDAASYTWCPMDPYDNDAGQRMVGRPQVGG